MIPALLSAKLGQAHVLIFDICRERTLNRYRVEAFEAGRIHIAAEIVEDLPPLPRLWRDKPSRPCSIEIRSLPTLAHCFPRSFTFYVAHPIHSLHQPASD